MGKIKTLLVIIFVFLILVSITKNSFANSEEYLILKKSNESFIIYIKNYFKNDFEFAFNDNSLATEEELDFINNAKDQNDGYNVAYISKEMIEDYFEDNKTFIFIKQNDEIIKNLEIDLSKNVVLSEETVEFVKNTTTRIKVDTELVSTETKEENGIKYTTETGKLVIIDDASAKYYYKLIKLPATEKTVEYDRFFELAKNSNKTKKLEIIENLETTQDFFDLYNQLLPQEWNEIVDMTIEQPDSKDGDKYIVWLKKEKDSEIIEDVQFLIATRKVTEEFVKDVHQEQHLVAQPVEQEISLFNGAIKLPVTYDSIALFVVLGVLVIILLVVIILKRKSKKEENEN